MKKIWLVIKNKTKGYTFTKYFETEFEKDIKEISEELQKETDKLMEEIW